MIDTTHPIVITECPKCGAMQAKRSPYLEPLKDENGKPDPDRTLLMKIECLGCWEPIPMLAPQPMFYGLPVIGDKRMPSSMYGLLPRC